MEKLIKVTRTLTYIGPESWIEKTKDHSFVVLARELGENRVILSDWELPCDVSQAEVLDARDKAFVYQERQRKPDRGEIDDN